MFSNLQLQSDFRSLTPETFNEKLRFGNRTIIYGHNGSGKSSIAELFYQLSEGTLSSPIRWYDRNRNLQKVKQTNVPSGVVTSSFCKSWIKDNVSEFLDGSSAASIVTLGKTAQDAKAEEEALTKSVESLVEQIPDAEIAAKDAKNAVETVIKAIQDSIESILRDIDNREYTKNRYNTTKVRTLLLATPQVFPKKEQHDQNLGILNQAKLNTVELQRYPEFDWDCLIHETKELLAENIHSKVIDELLGNTPLQEWLQEGLELHQGMEQCNFCLGSISSARMVQLQQHFDESRTKVRDRANILRAQIKSHRESISNWWNQVPDSSQLYPELAEDFQQSLTDEEERLERYREKLTDLDKLLIAKFEAPERTDFTVVTTLPRTPGESFENVANKHNELAGKDHERKLDAAKDVLAFLIGTQAQAFSKLDSAKTTKDETLEKMKENLQMEQNLLQKAKSKQFSSAEMAAQISRDLEIVYGKNHLKIEVSQDGKHYQCTRGSQPAKNLSEGERNSLALLYFLRSLEDQSKEVSRSQRLIVIDDPSSSLDREAVFATHSWLLRSLEKYEQSIILTHDFELLRLFLNSQKSQLSQDQKSIREGSAKDATPQAKQKKEKAERAPRITFLELLARTNEDGSRSSKLEPLSETFLKFHSEYHFLFDRLLTGLENPHNHELIFLLPNAARRVLESFVSFHVPGMSGFEQQLKKIALTDCNEEYRDVYDFCNRFSHGEGREHQLVLDSTTVFHQVRRSLELIKHTDFNHYQAMSRAVERKQMDPLSGQPWEKVK